MKVEIQERCPLGTTQPRKLWFKARADLAKEEVLSADDSHFVPARQPDEDRAEVIQTTSFYHTRWGHQPYQFLCHTTSQPVIRDQLELAGLRLNLDFRDLSVECHIKQKKKQFILFQKESQFFLWCFNTHL